MKFLIFCSLLFLFPIVFVAQENLKIPEGEITGPFEFKSEIYPGTQRDYWIYVPQQYDKTKPTCLMVVQDGLAGANWISLPNTLDSLIATKDIPVMIGVFIDHGKVMPADEENFPRYNRSFEYDATGDRYSRFLHEEILPEVEKSYNISANPNDRSIGGSSSGAIAAFNVAWERPDSFRRVVSAIGSYVGLRGGEDFTKLIRVTEPKPLRIFLEDGKNDLNIYAGGWWTANLSMLSALEWAGYEVNHNWGEGEHNSEHAEIILPEILKWLWKDYPQPVESHPENNSRLLNFIIKEESWKELPLPDLTAKNLAVNKAGEIFFSHTNSVYKIDGSGKPLLFTTVDGKPKGLSFNADGKLYVADPENRKIITVDTVGNVNEIVNNVNVGSLAITKKGIYFSDTAENRIGFFDFMAKTVNYFNVPGIPEGLVVSAEQSFLNVALSDGLFGYSFKIEENGQLAYGQEYVHYYIPYGIPFPQTRGLTVDAANNLYSATALGVQISDQLGRINYIFSPPAKNATDVKIGGSNFDILYLSSNGKLFSRKIKAEGILSWLPPVTPPKPGL